MIVGDEVFPRDIEHRELEAVSLDLDRGADRNVISAAELELRSARGLR
jgi:hypothetical protein